jgi:hypothetical protein
MSSLLRADKEFAFCRSRKGGACNGGRGACWEAGERVRGGSDGMHGARLSKDWGPRARAERTSNMRLMPVTLEVSKLSGWLKDDAYCRVEGEGMRCGEGEVRAGRREGPGWWRHTRGMHGEKARLKAWGPRARAERTQNISRMVVTLEVSMLSGWLKADAACQVEGRACDAGGRGVRAGWREGLGCGGVGTQARHARERSVSWLGGQGHARSARRTCSPCS